MHKISSSKSSVYFAANSFINVIFAVLMVLITFNLSWFFMFMGLYSQATVMRNLNKAIFNLESLLLIGNLGIFFLFLTYALGIRNLRSILGRRA